MRRHQSVALVGLAMLVAGVVGCASYPISGQYRASVSKNVNFTMVLRNPDAYVGAAVIWGGRIVETVNNPSGSQIIILETPLQGWEEPGAAEYSPGRFIAETPEFLDPAVYKPGKKITLAGEITGGETKSLGNTQYTYPVIAVKELHLWTEPKMYTYEPMDYWPWWTDVGWVYETDHWAPYRSDGDRDRDRGEGHEGEQHEGGHEGGERAHEGGGGDRR